ncbi:hypothetical protein Tco_1141215 [Tanacetum coccineum]
MNRPSTLLEVETNRIGSKCNLGREIYYVAINRIPFELGSFDVVVVQGEWLEENLKHLASMKADEKKLEDIPISRIFLRWVANQGVHGVQNEKRVWFEVELQGAQGDHEAEVFQVSNDDVTVAQRRLEDKQLEEKTNMDCLVKEQENVHLGKKVRANIMVTRVPGQKGAEGNVAEKKKVKKSKKANLGKLLKYNDWSTS